MEGELRAIRLAAVGAEGEVEENEVLETWDGVGERIFVIATKASVIGLREVDFVQKFIVEIEANEVFVPIHAPDVELVGPIWIFFRKVG